VFVAGTSQRRNGAGLGDYATAAYRASTGARLWVRRYDSRGHGDDSAAAVVASTDGRTVFLTGTSTGVRSHADWATVAYRAATGARVWVRRHDGPVSSEDVATSLAVGPGGDTVYVAGASWLDSPENRTAPAEYVTIAYGAAAGDRRPADWRERPLRRVRRVARPGRARCRAGRPARHAGDLRATRRRGLVIRKFTRTNAGAGASAEAE
jgi:hypothetical protein